MTTIGEVDVAVRADLRALGPGFAAAEAATRAFSQNTNKHLAAATASYQVMTHNVRSLTSAVQVLQGPLGGISSRIQAATTLLRNVGPVLGATALGFLGLGIALRGMIRNTIEAEQAQVGLQTILRATGRDVEIASNAILRNSAALQQKTAFDDESITRAQTRLLTYSKVSRDILDRTTKATLDFAQATGRDLESAAIALGSALQDPADGLGRINRELRLFSAPQAAAIDQMVKMGQTAKAQEIILSALEAKFKGTAEAAKSTLGGALKSLANTFGDLTEVSGGPLRVMTAGVNILNDNLSRLATIVLTSLAGGFILVISRMAGHFTDSAVAVVRHTAAIRAAAQEERALVVVEQAHLSVTRSQLQAQFALAQLRLNGGMFLAPGRNAQGSGREVEIARMANATEALNKLTLLEIAAQARYAAAFDKTGIAARAATVSMGLLRGVLAFFGGWVGLGITAAAAAGFYLYSNSVKEAAGHSANFKKMTEDVNFVLDKQKGLLAGITADQREVAFASAEIALASGKRELALKQAQMATSVGQFDRLPSKEGSLADFLRERISKLRIEILGLDQDIEESQKNLANIFPPLASKPPIDEHVVSAMERFIAAQKLSAELAGLSEEKRRVALKVIEAANATIEDQGRSQYEIISNLAQAYGKVNAKQIENIDNLEFMRGLEANIEKIKTDAANKRGIPGLLPEDHGEKLRDAVRGSIGPLVDLHIRPEIEFGKLTAELETQAYLAQFTGREYEKQFAIVQAQYQMGRDLTANEAEKVRLLIDQRYHLEEAAAVSRDMASGFTDWLREVRETGKASFDSLFNHMVNSFTNALDRMVQKMIESMLMDLFVNLGVGALSGGGKSITGVDANAFIPANVAHFGLGSGRSGYQRRVPAGMFANAPRFHNGLSSDEFPAILQQGEQVLSRNDVRRGGGALSINVMVNGARGNTEIRQMVMEGVKNGLETYDRQALPSRVSSLTKDPRMR